MGEFQVWKWHFKIVVANLQQNYRYTFSLCHIIRVTICLTDEMNYNNENKAKQKFEFDHILPTAPFCDVSPSSFAVAHPFLQSELCKLML